MSEFLKCHIYVCVNTHECVEYEWNITHILKIETLPFATAWKDLEGIILSEINQRKRNTV